MGRGGEGSREGGKANQTNQICPPLSTGSTGREWKMELSGNVLGCVPLTMWSTADGGRRRKGGVQGKLWGYTVTRDDLLGSEFYPQSPQPFLPLTLLRPHPTQLCFCHGCGQSEATHASIRHLQHSNFKNFFFFLLYMCILPACMPVYHVPTENRRGHWIPGTGVLGGCQLTHRCW